MPRQRGGRRAGLGIGLGVGMVLVTALFVYIARSSMASVSGLPEYRFDPRRVDVGRSYPDWLVEPALKRAFFAAYLRAAGPAFSLLDDDAIADFETRLASCAWIERVQARPRLPHSMDLELILRRPAAAYVDQRGRLWALAEDGKPLPLEPGKGVRALEQQLGPLRLAQGPLALPGDERHWDAGMRPFGLPLLFGDAGRDGGHASGGARIAALVRNRLLPTLRQRVTDLPPFLGVDISNGDLLLVADRAEYRLIFLDPLGRPVYLDWGHAPGSRYEVLPWQGKERLFRRLLEVWPHLKGIRRADLRFPNSWREQVSLRAGGNGESSEPEGR